MYDYNGDKLNEIYTYNSNFDSSYSALLNRKFIDNKLEIDRFIRYNSLNKELCCISIEKEINDDSFQNQKNFLYNSTINKIGNKNEKELREKIEKNENINNIYNLIEENENNKKIYLIKTKILKDLEDFEWLRLYIKKIKKNQ